MKMSYYKKLFPILFILLISTSAFAEDGYELWQRYSPITDPSHKSRISELFREVALPETGGTYDIIRNEIALATKGMLGAESKLKNEVFKNTSLAIGTIKDMAIFQSVVIAAQLSSLGSEGYFIGYADKRQKQLVIAANEPVGALYGTFHLLRILQSGSDIKSKFPISESPKVTHRLLNHWDNIDRTVERGYAGFSIWDWHKLPDYIDTRYIDYARANASIGINGTVLTNVNANAIVLTPQYIEKVKALADLFRPYGIKVYLTARFSAPIELDKMKTADPLDAEVQKWWKNKATEIYTQIPDFGGFVVKANSEGQPGPQDYGRTHADGANMLAEAVAPHGGIVMWRAFVYSHEAPEDRAKQANNEFEPFDGDFKDNVFIQVKNGAIDFQPREPFHPLFGAMPKTKLAPELQITMEYLGQATSLVFLAPLFKECLDSKTFRPNTNSTVASVIDGSDYGHTISAIAGVANIGTDRNWTGHLFNQSNWYAFGRLAWNHELSSEEIAVDWVNQTFSAKPVPKTAILEMMLSSRETVVNYMTPLGLHHIMGWDHHYGPGPWVTGGRPDWTSPYYHRADSAGIGFDRTATGSDALSQYAPEISSAWSDPKTCPEKYLLWFHHLPWDYKMKSGNTLWDEMCIKYDAGVKAVSKMKYDWRKLEPDVDQERFRHVSMLLAIQEKEAKWWRNSCLLYFQQFSGMPFPNSIEQPEGALEYYMNLRFPYAPGIRPKW
jgi:alpha-glucuronidase